mgnify:CR=1 FL=1|tara:strand:- start:10095 stop:10400 length:306 start_codon:yes stop_codon:yes gene_type:complete
MKKLSLIPIYFFIPACATVGKLLPGGEEQADALGESVLTAAPMLAEQAGTLTTMMTGNPAMGGAVATMLGGAAALFAAKKRKAKKDAEEWEVVEEEEETVA